MSDRTKFDLTFTQAVTIAPVGAPVGGEAASSYSKAVSPGAADTPIPLYAAAIDAGIGGTSITFGGGRVWGLGELESVSYDRGSNASLITVVTKPDGVGPGEGTVLISIPPTADQSRYMVQLSQAALAADRSVVGPAEGWPLSLIQTMTYPGAS